MRSNCMGQRRAWGMRASHSAVNVQICSSLFLQSFGDLHQDNITVDGYDSNDKKTYHTILRYA